MQDQSACKAQLRQQLRALRRGLDPAAQLAAAEAASRHITELPGWRSIRRIALYLAQDGEIDTAPLQALCRSSGKQVFLPIIDDGDRLGFAEWIRDDQLVANRYGIPEPGTDAPRCDPSELDAIVMPLVGWDRKGGRLGMGGGFYDRSLEGVAGPLLVGLAHSLQQLARVPRDDWDISLNFVVTESALLDCQGND